MTKHRDSLQRLGRELADLVLNGDSGTSKAYDLAGRLSRLCRDGGRYERRYDDPEQRVLMRHLNLYKNKLAKAQTEVERIRWRAKLTDQQAKIAAYESDREMLDTGTADLDLDGL